MKTLLLFLFLITFSMAVLAQAPVNDSIQNAIVLTQTSNFCSKDAQYTNVNATLVNAGLPAGWNNQGLDVWFAFTATHSDVNITVTGASTGGGSTGGTLRNPLLALYLADATFTSDTDVVATQLKGASVTSLYKGGLTIGKTYYIRVSAENSNTGTFRLCIDNYTPPMAPGQDCSSASFLCSKESFTQTNVVGAGANRNETAGTCLAGSDSNTAWYKWQAGNNGTLTFTITPTTNTDDIDWVLFDLGPTNNCTISSANAIRCAAGHGVDNSGCPNEPLYYKTGLSMTETDINEASGCGQGQNGFVKYVDMTAGHYYGLLVNNFTSGNNGFTMSFGGTGEFVGPKATMQITDTAPCVPGRAFNFTSQVSNYASYSWSFGEGATPASVSGATVPASVNVTYSTPGIKTAVLLVTSGQGCTVVSDTTFTIVNKPPTPSITALKPSYCLLDTLVLTTPYNKNYTYQWTGPNNFTSTAYINKLALTSYNMAGTYSVTVSQSGCTSDPASVTLLTIGQKPVDNFTITPVNLCTPQQSFNITNNTTDYTNLQWNYGAGANAPTVINANTVNVTYSTYGQKTVTLTATGNTGCTTTLAQTLTVPQKPAVPVITSNGKVCVGDTLRLTTTSTGDSYLWSGPNGFTSTTATVKLPATAAIAGTYTLMVTVGLCSSDAGSIVIDPSQIIPVPVASFTANPVIPSSLPVPTSVAFTNTSTQADSYLWSFGDGSTSTAVNPVHTYNSKGDFTVTLTATSQGTCNNSVSKGKLILRYNVVIFIPNTFTPNGDGVNDVFNVKITSLKTYHISIFNRLGSKLFDGYDLANAWAGTYQGRPVPTGTYYYVIDAVSLNDDNLKESGFVTVLR